MWSAAKFAAAFSTCREAWKPSGAASAEMPAAVAARPAAWVIAAASAVRLETPGVVGRGQPIGASLWSAAAGGIDRGPRAAG